MSFRMQKFPPPFPVKLLLGGLCLVVYVAWYLVRWQRPIRRTWETFRYELFTEAHRRRLSKNSSAQTNGSGTVDGHSEQSTVPLTAASLAKATGMCPRLALAFIKAGLGGITDSGR